MKKKQEKVEVDVLKEVPRNKFDPEKWPKPVFYNKTYKAAKDGNGEFTGWVETGGVNGEFPTYVRDSYCYHRVYEEMGLTPQGNMIALVGSQHYWDAIFTSDERDNIDILVYTLDREVIPLKRTKETSRVEDFGGASKGTSVYTVKRLNEKNRKEDGGKYVFPSHDQSDITYPFIPPRLVSAWENGEKLETLVLTEGYFKAMKASMCGANVVGLGSITLYEDTSTGGIYRDVKRLIVGCDVENVVILYDGDCTDISKGAEDEVDDFLQPTKDLTKRPMGFLASLNKLYALLHKECPRVRIWFEYVDSRHLPNESKGLDDLLIDQPEETQYIVEDLHKPTAIGRYFVKVNMTGERNRLNEYFFLNSPQDFYRRHKGRIGVKPFLYRGTIYKYSSEKNTIEEVVGRDIMAYKRIGTNYYKQSKKPTLAKDDNGDYVMAEVLLPWSRQAITDDYGKEVLSKIRKYEGFTNLPSHDNYQRVIGSHYNLYAPLVYKPSEEALLKTGCRTIMSTIEHIFGRDNTGIDPESPEYDHNSQFELGLDYVQLLYQQPTQNLPILCLVSQERGTGKTSFLDLLRVMFSDNTVIVGNAQMTSNFNTLICGRLVVGVDESSLADNKKFTESLKMWSTSKDMPMEGKGKDAVLVPNFTKYILCSNDERRFIYASSDEVRFWVRRVPKWREEEIIANVLTVFQQEMPAFMAYLNKRDISYKGKIKRMFFDEDVLHTPWLDNLLEAQRPKSEKIMRKWLHDYFIDCAETPVLLTTAAKLQDAIGYVNPKFRTVDQDLLEQYIEENMHVQRWEGGKNKRFKFSILNPNTEEDNAYIKIEGNGRPYEFRAEMFINSDEYAKKFGEQVTEQPIPFDGSEPF